MAVIFISSELPEVLRCADRLLVMREHKACGLYSRGELDDNSILEAISAQAFCRGRRQDASETCDLLQAVHRHALQVNHPSFEQADAGACHAVAARLFCIPGFFHLELKAGHLYASVVDILIALPALARRFGHDPGHRYSWD